MRLLRVLGIALFAVVCFGWSSGVAAAEVPQFCAVGVDDTTGIICARSPAALESAWSSRPAASRTQVVIATLYDNMSFDPSAGYLNIYASSNCSTSKSTADFHIGDLSTWRDRVSSFDSYGNCAARLWSGTGYSGTAFPSSSSYQVASSYVGSGFNDRARSVQFS